MRRRRPTARGEEGKLRELKFTAAENAEMAAQAAGQAAEGAMVAGRAAEQAIAVSTRLHQVISRPSHSKAFVGSSSTSHRGSQKREPSPANPWNKFQRNNAGRGWSMETMRAEYYKLKGQKGRK